ncbi:MAG: hypothetical protein ACRDJP_13200 [Actinomycetota bacterium]
MTRRQRMILIGAGGAAGLLALVLVLVAVLRGLRTYRRGRVH